MGGGEGEYNLRAFIVPLDGILERDLAGEFLKQLGPLLEELGPYSDMGVYEDLSDKDIGDALLGRGEFPFRPSRGKEGGFEA